MGAGVRVSPGLVGVCAAWVLISGVARAEAPRAKPWLGAPFSGDPRAIAAAAKAWKGAPDDAAEILVEELTSRFDAEGRKTSVDHQVRIVLMEDGVEGSSVIRVYWEPWHEKRPEVRVRVVTPDGLAHTLDPATLVESGDAEQPGPTFSDVRVLTGPLPSVGVGSVVEEEIVRTETAPLFAAGSVSSIAIGNSVRVDHEAITIEYPSSLPLRHVLRGRQGRPLISEKNGVKVVRYEFGPLEGVPDGEPQEPPDDAPAPYVAFSTGPSWNAVARSYGAVVDEKVAASDLRALASEVIGPHATRDEALARVAAWIPAHVRYTGLELGSSSIIPAAPQQTLTRRYGDCKDLATLAVGLLRASGVAAEVALLQVRGNDPDPELPGLGDFDHAIVHLPGTPERWYDATAGLAPPGELPSWDQGRSALLATPGATGLVRTPEQEGPANLVEVETTYRMAEIDRAHATERHILRGAVGRGWRGALSGSSADEAKKAFGEKAAERLLAEKVVAVQSSDPRDVSKPLEVSVELEHVGRATTTDDQASAALLRLPLLEGLGDFFAPAKEGEPRPRRTHPVLLGQAIQVQWTYRVIPPPGYAIRGLPPARERKLGPARFTETFRTEADGAVTAALRFEAPRRLSAEGANQLRDELETLRKETGLTVTFDRVGAVALGRGDIAVGLAEYQRLVALHPKEALHEAQLAMALLGVGMGGLAREHARRAVQLQPDWAPGHRILGYILERDLLGRADRAGADLEAAVTEYKKAQTLSPTDARSDAGVLRIRLVQAEADGPGKAAQAHLEEAIAAGKRLSQELKNHESDRLYLAALFQARRYAEVRALAPRMAQTKDRDALWMASVAHLEGGPATRTEVDRQAGSVEERSNALAMATGILVSTRDYPLAVQVLEAGRDLFPPSDPIFALIGSLRAEEPSASPSTARGLLVAAASATFHSGEKTQAWDKLVRAGPTAQVIHAVATDLINFKNQTFRISSSAAVSSDIAVAGATIEEEPGPAGGLRLTLRTPRGSAQATWFAVREKQRLVIIGTGTELSELGAEALRLADAGDWDGAREWLDWARARFPAQPERDQGFVHFWPARPGVEPKQAVLRAAATLAGGSSAQKRAAEVLEAAYQATPPGPERSALALSWLWTTTPQKADHKLFTARLEEAAATLEPAQRFQLRLAAATDLDARCAILDQRLKESADDARLAGMQLSCLTRRSLEAAVEYGKAQVAAGHAAPVLLNNLAWAELFIATPPQELVASAERAAASSNSPGTENTLAVAFASAGRLAEAKSHFLKSMEERDVLEDSDWVAYGRLAQAFGLIDEAAAAYRRAKPEQPDSPNSSYQLAQRFLAQLPKK